MKLVCKKLNADTYQMKWCNSDNWATIVLVDYGDNRQGKIMIQSDWGNYHAGWGSMGSSLREFLTRMDEDYIKNNLVGRPDWLDEDATKAAMLKFLKEEEKHEDFVSVEMTLDEFFDNWDGGSLQSFWQCFYRDEASELFTEPQYIPTVVDYTPRFRRFMEICWPEFIAILKEELSEGERTEKPADGAHP